MSVKPEWWEWLLSSPYTLKQKGLNPAQRLAFTGHRRAMSLNWARTIGMWCTRTAIEIREASQTNLPAYNLFQQRNGLFTKPVSWKRNYPGYDKAEYDMFCETMTACMAHRMIIDRLETNPRESVGYAANALTGRVISDHRVPLSSRPLVPYSMGILPIEAVVYYHSVNHAIEEAGMNMTVWLKRVDESHSDPKVWPQLDQVLKITGALRLCELPDELKEARLY